MTDMGIRPGKLTELNLGTEDAIKRKKPINRGSRETEVVRQRKWSGNRNRQEKGGVGDVRKPQKVVVEGEDERVFQGTSNPEERVGMQRSPGETKGFPKTGDERTSS